MSRFICFLIMMLLSVDVLFAEGMKSDRIERTQAQSYLQSFASESNHGSETVPLAADTTSRQIQLPEVLPPHSYLQPSPSIPPLPQESAPQVVSRKDIKIFGQEIFDKASDAGSATSIFEPVVDMSVGPDYVIGPGDNLIVELWGKFETVHNLVVDRDGKVFIPNIGAVYVYGLSFTQLQKLLQDKFSKVYNDFRMNVTLGKLRTIKVFVVGEAVNPGAYTLSSLSTVFNALYAAGGPGIEGSMRNIRLIRENKVIDTIDLYRFLLNGDKSQDIRLCAGDTIFVPLRGPLVGVAGEIARPAMYELKGSTTLTGLITLAGEVKPTGYLHRIQIERLKRHEKNTVEDINLNELEKDKTKDIGVFDGDFLLVFPIPEQAYKYVELVGMVQRPGRYELKDGMRIGELLDEGKLLEEAYVEKIDIIRTHKDKHQQIISINLRDIMEITHPCPSQEGITPLSLSRGDNTPALESGSDTTCPISRGDLELQEWDRVVVYSSWDIKTRDRVSITGLVKNPGSYDLLEDMTVGDIICQAGGLTRADEISHAEIVRTTAAGQVEVIPVAINDVLAGDKERDIRLRQFDHVYVYSVFQPEPTPIVKITGQVKLPGVYSFSSGMRVSQLIARAGGLDKKAALLKAELSRMVKNETGVSFINMPLNLKGIMIENDINEDIILQEDDSLFIRQIPEWRKEDTVVVSGEVLFPGTYAVGEDERLSSVLERAGGFTKEAFLAGAIFIRQSVREQQEREIRSRFLLIEEEALSREEADLLKENLLPEELSRRQQALANKKELLRLSMAKLPKGRITLKLAQLERLKRSHNDVILQDGDSLFIPKTPVSVTIIGEVYNPGAILCYQNRVRDYIKAVGGLTRNADRSAVYVIKPDGRVKRQGFLGYSTIGPGDTIVAPPRVVTGISFKEMVAIIYQLAASVAVIANVFK